MLKKPFRNKGNELEKAILEFFKKAVLKKLSIKNFGYIFSVSGNIRLNIKFDLFINKR
jgi:hypothetical protein